MNRNRIVRFAVDAAETKRILAGLLSALALLAAGPAAAFEAIAEADGSTTYFFGTPSLRIESAGALDLSGLRRIEAFADGVRANGSFQLAAGGTLRADFGRVSLGDAHNLTVTAGGALDWSGSSGLNDYVRADGGDIVMEGYFSSDGLSAGLVYRWTGNDRPLPSQITLVPEPQAWLLLAAGLALVQVFRRRGGAHASGST